MDYSRVLTLAFVPVAAVLTWQAWRRSLAFGTAFLLLVVYTIFAQIAHSWYPQLLYVIYPHQPFSAQVFGTYWVYVVFTLTTIVVLSKPLYGTRIPFELYTQPFTTGSRRLVEVACHGLLAGMTGFLLYRLWANYSVLSYANQAVLKNDHLWFWLFEMTGIVMMSLVARITGSRDLPGKAPGVMWLAVIGTIALVTAIRAGQRIELLQTTLSLGVFSLSLRKHSTVRDYVRVIIVGLVALLVMQAIRSFRGSSIEWTALLMNLPRFVDRFAKSLSFREIVFQDYSTPSLSLMYSIEHGLVIPGQVLMSNLMNAAVFLNSPTLGAILSRLLEPSGWCGYGYYLLTEGYNLLGMAGSLYIALVFVLGVWGLDKVLGSSQEKLVYAYMQGMVAFVSLGFVRGQSSWFLKSLYMEIIPGLLLFALVNGRAIGMRRTRSRPNLSELS